MLGLQFPTRAVLEDDDYELSAGFSCQVANFNQKDLWVRVLYQDKPLYDFRIGAGGVIAEFRDATVGYRKLLMSPSRTGGEIDRVIQEVFWAYNIYPNPVPSTEPHESLTWYALNMNQAGAEHGDDRIAFYDRDIYGKPMSAQDSGNFSRTLDIKSNVRKCSFDILSLNDKHFLERLKIYPRSFQVALPTLTQIRLRGPGIIRVRNRVVLARFDAGNAGAQEVDFKTPVAPGKIGSPLSGAQNRIPGLLTLASWIPLDKSMSHVAFYLKPQRESADLGSGDWYYRSDQLKDGLIPKTSFSNGEAETSATHGYASYVDPIRKSGVAIIYGKQNAACFNAEGAVQCPADQGVVYRIRPTAFGNSESDADFAGDARQPTEDSLGIGNPILSLNLRASNLPVNSMIEKTYEISRFHGGPGASVATWTEAVTALPQSKIFLAPPSNSNSPERLAYDRIQNAYRESQQSPIKGLASTELGKFKPSAAIRAAEMLNAPAISTTTMPSCFAGQSSLTVKTFDYKKVYVPNHGRETTLRATVFYPPSFQPAQKLPALLSFHGGGWAIGTPTFYFPASAYFASRGMITFSFQYRLSGAHGSSAEESVRDARTAIRWVRKNAEMLGVDPDKIYFMGDSAGGNLALTAPMATTLSDETNLPEERFSTAAKAVFAFYPVIREYLNRIGPPPVGARPVDLLSVTQADAIPQVILFQGEKDEDTIPEFAREYCEKSGTKRKDSCAYIPFPENKHGFLGFAAEYQTSLAIIETQLMARGDLSAEPVAGAVERIRNSGEHCNAIKMKDDGYGKWWSNWDHVLGYSAYPYGVW